MSIHSAYIGCHFLVLWMKPTMQSSRSTLHFQCWAGCWLCYAMGIHQCFISADIRLSVSNAYSSIYGGEGEKVGGRASQSKDPVGPTQESAAEEILSLFWRFWKGPKGPKRNRNKNLWSPLAGFSTQRIKRLQSHTAGVNGWVTWMKTRVLPLRVGYIYKTTVIWSSLWPNIYTQQHIQ